jgi:hypothetical protein
VSHDGPSNLRLAGACADRISARAWAKQNMKIHTLTEHFYNKGYEMEKGGNEMKTEGEKRFDYVKYDDKSLLIQDEFKQRTFYFEQAIEVHLSNGRAKALALTKLEECYMWIGKAIRDDQLACEAKP